MPVLGDKFYKFLKLLTTVLLPGAAALYLALVGIWHFPAGEQVAGTIAAVNVFLGGLLHLSTATYNGSGTAFDGTLGYVNHDSGSTLKLKSLDMNAVATKSSVTLKVDPPEPQVSYTDHPDTSI
jgi:hypothetical protein